VSTAQLRREISHLRKRRPPRGHLVSEDRLEFAQSLEIVPDLWQEQLLGSEAPAYSSIARGSRVNPQWPLSWHCTRRLAGPAP
jgi:hypothetical protein